MPLLKPTRGIQLNKSHPFARGLVGYWLFNEGCGGRVFDSSGYSNSGIFIADVKWVPGKFGSVLYFDGTGDYVNAGEIEGLQNAGQLTVAVRHKSDDPTSAGRGLVSGLQSGGNKIFDIYQRAVGKYDFRVINSSGTTVTAAGTTIFDDLKWHYWVGTWDGTTIRQYVDGIPEGTTASLSGNLYGVGQDDLYIGNAISWGFWLGQIDHVMVCNRALTAFEIGLLYRKPFCMFEPALNIARLSSVVSVGFIEIEGTLSAASSLSAAAFGRARGIAGGVAAVSSLAGSIKVSKKISGAIAATSSLSGTLSLVGEVSRSRGSGFKPIEGAERLRGLRRSAFY